MSDIAICPHCRGPGILVTPQSHYSRGWPATCRKCGSLSYDQPHVLIRAARLALEFLGLPLLLFAGFVFPTTMTVVLCAIPLLIVFWWYHRKRRQPETYFYSISLGGSRLARRLTYGSILVTLAAVIISVAAPAFHSSVGR